jgi:hypothetical protein
LVAAVEQCVSAGAKVINMSLGGPMSSNFENNAFGSLLSQGIIPIAAGEAFKMCVHCTWYCIASTDASFVLVKLVTTAIPNSLIPQATVMCK